MQVQTNTNDQVSSTSLESNGGSTGRTLDCRSQEPGFLPLKVLGVFIKSRSLKVLVLDLRVTN